MRLKEVKDKSVAMRVAHYLGEIQSMLPSFTIDEDLLADTSKITSMKLRQFVENKLITELISFGLDTSDEPTLYGLQIESLVSQGLSLCFALSEQEEVP